MKEIARAYIISKPYFLRQILSPWLYAFLAVCMVFTLLINWNHQENTAQIGLLQLANPWGDDKEMALRRGFYEFLIAGWLPFLGFVFVIVLRPVNMSYAVSQSLWLRLSHTSNITLALSRIFQILFSAALVLIASCILVLLYSTLHNVKIAPLIYSVYAVISYILLAGGIAISLSGKPTTQIGTRSVYIMLAMAAPMLLCLFARFLAPKFNGFFPYSIPRGINAATLSTAKAYFTAGAVGIGLMCLNLFVNVLSYQINRIKNLK
jgi:hypothetical protein